jgi:hypothetical protein
LQSPFAHDGLSQDVLSDGHLDLREGGWQSVADHRKPTPAEITIMAAGAVGLIFSFFDFYKVDAITLGSQSYGGASANVWSSGLFPVAALMVVFVIVMAAQVALAKFANVSMPRMPLGFTWEQVHLVLGGVATLYAVAYLFVDKGNASFGIGYWFILAGCIAALVGAVLLQRERATGPVM